MHPLSGSSLKAAIIAAQRQDQAAFDLLYEHYTDAVYRYLYARCGDPRLAEELVGDLWLRVVQHIASFRLPDEGAERAFSAWLYRIAHNLAANQHRRKKHQLVPIAEDWPSSEPEPEQSIVAQEQRAEIRQALAHLTPDQREVLVLRFFEGYSSAEVAARTSRTERAVRALQYRALGALARVLNLRRTAEG